MAKSKSIFVRKLRFVCHTFWGVKCIIWNVKGQMLPSEIAFSHFLLICASDDKIREWYCRVKTCSFYKNQNDWLVCVSFVQTRRLSWPDMFWKSSCLSSSCHLVCCVTHVYQLMLWRQDQAVGFDRLAPPPTVCSPLCDAASGEREQVRLPHPNSLSLGSAPLSQIPSLIQCPQVTLEEGGSSVETCQGRTTALSDRKRTQAYENWRHDKTNQNKKQLIHSITL